jgi:hypothetical protein
MVKGCLKSGVMNSFIWKNLLTVLEELFLQTDLLTSRYFATDRVLHCMKSLGGVTIIGKVERQRRGQHVTPKQRIMAAQRGDRRVQAITWRPMKPTHTQQGNTEIESFAVSRIKVQPSEFAIGDDAFPQVVAPPRKIFEAALKHLTDPEEQTRTIAFNTLRVLATEGSHAAMCEARYAVGECLFYGRGVQKDLHRAAQYFKTVRPVPWPSGLLETPGNAQANAQFILGDYFEYHSSDTSKALVWYARAANQGHPLAA